MSETVSSSSQGKMVKPARAQATDEVMTIPDISLMIRAGFDEKSIIEDIKRKGLPHSATPDEIDRLAQLGASRTLLNLLTNPDYILTVDEVKNYEARKKEKAALAEKNLLNEQHYVPLEVPQPGTATAAGTPVKTPSNVKPSLLVSGNDSSVDCEKYNAGALPMITVDGKRKIQEPFSKDACARRKHDVEDSIHYLAKQCALLKTYQTQMPGMYSYSFINVNPYRRDIARYQHEIGVLEAELAALNEALAK